jgi:hypothetical protein
MKKQDTVSEFDFGFSFTDETEQLETKLEQNQKDKSELEQRLHLLYNSITIFLDNLSKNPEKTTIHWPNRLEKIQEFKKKLSIIVEGTSK